MASGAQTATIAAIQIRLYGDRVVQRPGRIGAEVPARVAEQLAQRL